MGGYAPLAYYSFTPDAAILNQECFWKASSNGAKATLQLVDDENTYKEDQEALIDQFVYYAFVLRA